MELLACSVAPRYAQVAIFDPDLPDSYPDGSDGDDEVAISNSAVAIATVRDSQARVSTRVVTGEPPTSDARVIFGGTIRVSAGRLLVGSVTDAETHECRTTAGDHVVRISTRSPVGRVDNLVIHVDQALGVFRTDRSLP